MLLGMPFLTSSGADIDFLDWELRWRTYTTQVALPTTRRVELVGKKEFAAAALDPESETFVVHVASLSSVASPSSSPLKEFAAAALDPEHETYVVHVGSVSSIASPSSSPLDVHPSRRPQIAGLIAEEAPKVPDEYADFANVLLPWTEALHSWSKCHFRQEKVRFPGYVVPTQGDPGLHQSQYEIFRCSSGFHLTSMLRGAHQQTHQLARPICG